MGLVPYNQGACIALFPYGYWFRGLHRSVRTSYRQIQLLSPPSSTFSAALFLPVQKFYVWHTSLLPPLSNFVVNALMIIEKYRFASSETNCQGLFNQIHKKSTKRCQKHYMAPDTSFDRLHCSVQQVFAEIRIVWQLVDIYVRRSRGIPVLPGLCR